MARNYAALPHEYLEEMAVLSNSEFGRLCRALLVYSRDGEEVRLEGAEKVLLKRVILQEDRFQRSYDEQVAARRSAGKKGAAKRWGTAAEDGKHSQTESQSQTETEPQTEPQVPPPAGGRPESAPEPIPSLRQVEEAARERGCLAYAKSFYDYYAAAGWRDGEGRPVYSWRQKLVAWQMREEKREKEREAKRAPNQKKGWAELARELEAMEP